MSQPLTNPERLLLALDEGLDHQVALVLYGRSAVTLGFAGTPEEVGDTKDVDAIIRLVELDALVNERFKDEGLYITHLFQEDQVFLRPEWEQHIVPVLRPPTHAG